MRSGSICGERQIYQSLTGNVYCFYRHEMPDRVNITNICFISGVQHAHIFNRKLEIYIKLKCE